jgi:hypothetical protein
MKDESDRSGPDSFSPHPSAFILSLAGTPGWAGGRPTDGPAGGSMLDTPAQASWPEPTTMAVGRVMGGPVLTIVSHRDTIAAVGGGA